VRHRALELFHVKHVRAHVSSREQLGAEKHQLGRAGRRAFIFDGGATSERISRHKPATRGKPASALLGLSTPRFKPRVGRQGQEAIPKSRVSSARRTWAPHVRRFRQHWRCSRVRSPPAALLVDSDMTPRAVTSAIEPMFHVKHRLVGRYVAAWPTGQPRSTWRISCLPTTAPRLASKQMTVDEPTGHIRGRNG